MRSRRTPILTVVLILLLHAPLAALSLTLTDQGRSTYRILIAQPAPESVLEVAVELQRLVHVATGAKLAIMRRADGTDPYIRLGAAAVQAGLRVDVARDGFRLQVRSQDLLIAGPDDVVDTDAAGRLMRMKGVIDSSSSEHRGLLWSTARLFPFGPGQESPVGPGGGCWQR